MTGEEHVIVTREEYVIVETIAAAVRCASAMFEASEDEGEYHPNDIEIIADEVLKKTSKFQVENLWTVLDMALKSVKI